MSRQQFIAELTQYLTFISPDEREQIIAVFEERFDNAGPEGESELIMELGTPMSIAIAFKRRKESGELEIPEPSVMGKPEAEEAREEAKPASKSIPEVPAEIVEASELTAASASDAIVAAEASVEIPAMTSGGESAQIEPDETDPGKKLTAGAAVAATLLSILIGALLLIPAAAGGYLIILMANFIFGALQTLSTVTDALWMLSMGFSVGALGLIILWLFLWAIISISRRLFRGKSGKKSVFKLRMKKTWKVIWIIFSILLALGIACGAVGYSMNGRPEDLYDNPVSVILINWIRGNAVAQFLSMIFN